MLLNDIWLMAGQVLATVPNCPLHLAKAVHRLLGRDPPASLLNSPVSQVSQREAHMDQALQRISDTAQEVQAQRSSQAFTQAAPQQGPARPPVSSAADSGAASSQQQQQEVANQEKQCVNILTAALSNVTAGPRLTMPEMTAVYLPVLQVAGAVMTPLVKKMVQAEATNKQLLREVQDIKSDTTEVKRMLYSNASFPFP